MTQSVFVKPDGPGGKPENPKAAHILHAKSAPDCHHRLPAVSCRTSGAATLSKISGGESMEAASLFPDAHLCGACSSHTLDTPRAFLGTIRVGFLVCLSLVERSRSPQFASAQLSRHCLKHCLKPEVAKARMIVRAASLWPMKLALGFLNRQVVDAGIAAAHQAVFVELPVLVAVGAEPFAVLIVPFVGKADRDPVAVECP